MKEVSLGKGYYRVVGKSTDANRTYEVRLWSWSPWKRLVTIIVTAMSVTTINGAWGKTGVCAVGTRGYDGRLAQLNAHENGIWYPDKWWDNLAVSWHHWNELGKPDIIGGWLKVSKAQKEAYAMYEKYSPNTWV